MTDAMTAPLPIITPSAPRLQPLGDPAAAACDGDVCIIPDHHEQAIINRRIDDDAI